MQDAITTNVCLRVCERVLCRLWQFVVAPVTVVVAVGSMCVPTLVFVVAFLYNYNILLPCKMHT